MKVLFISRSKGQNVSPLINNQAVSLQRAGIQVDHFLITGKGTFGYISNIFKLRKLRSKTQYDVYHAHYSLTGFVATLAGCKPLVVSLMGSDVYYSRIMRSMAIRFIKTSWKHVIVKSDHMAQTLNLTGLHVIPNGVDTLKYTIIDKEKAFEISKLDKNFKNILFIADPSIPEKNYKLAEAAVNLVDPKYKAKLVAVTKVSNNMIPFFMNAGDALLLPSLWEGSPNVVKEALACNLPVIATAVGDVPNMLRDMEGCFICTTTVNDIKSKIEAVLERGERVKGREKIEKLGLSEEFIAKKLKELYSAIK